MSVEIVILSPLSPPDLASVERSCRALVDRHESAETTKPWGELVPGGAAPSAAQAEALVWVDGRRAPAEHPKTREVLRRLDTVRSSVTLRASGADLEGMSVSILQYLLEHAGDGLALQADALQPSEDVLRDLAHRRGVPDFGDAKNRSVDVGTAAKGGQDAPGTMAVREFLSSLVRDESLILVENADKAALADRLLKFLEETDAVDAVNELGEWLLDQPEIEELFADDRALEATLRRHFAG